MKCFICGKFSPTLIITNKIMNKSFRKNIKKFCSKMYEDFVKAKQPDVCVNCQRIVQQSSNFKTMVLRSRNMINKTWFEKKRNKIDLVEIFGSLDPNEKQLNHVYDIKDESFSQVEPIEDTQNSFQGSSSEIGIGLEAIFCANDPKTMERVKYFKEQEPPNLKKIEDRENIPIIPTKVPAARRQRSISVSKAKCKAQNKGKRWMICSLCNDVLIDAKILRRHIGIHAK